jgi:hypothetical protein
MRVIKIIIAYENSKINKINGDLEKPLKVSQHTIDVEMGSAFCATPKAKVRPIVWDLKEKIPPGTLCEKVTSVNF